MAKTKTVKIIVKNAQVVSIKKEKRQINKTQKKALQNGRIKRQRNITESKEINENQEKPSH